MVRLVGKKGGEEKYLPERVKGIGLYTWGNVKGNGMLSKIATGGEEIAQGGKRKGGLTCWGKKKKGMTGEGLPEGRGKREGC